MKKWLVPALCALPFVGVLLWLIAGKNLSSLATFALFLACPLGHMFFMKHNNHKEGGEKHHG